MAGAEPWYISAAWWAVFVPAIVAAAGFGAWVERQLRAKRDAMPIIRCEWKTGSAGFTSNLEIQNRINEDLFITEARAKSDFAWYIYETDAGGSISGHTLHTAPSPRKLDWTVKPLCTSKFSIAAGGNRRWIRIKLSSSHRTLRAVWITLEDR